MHPVLAGGRQPDQASPVTQQGPQIAGGLGAIQASASRSTRSSWARVAASTLSFLEPGRGDWLAAAGIDQVRLQHPVPRAARPASPSRRRPPRPPGCPAGAHQGPRSARPGRWPGCGCAGGRRRRPRWRPGSACDACPSRRRSSSGPRFPSSTGPPSLGCRAEQGRGPDPHSVRSLATVDRQEMCSTWTGNLWGPSALYAKLMAAWAWLDRRLWYCAGRGRCPPT
jgi:hypothetical protein